MNKIQFKVKGQKSSPKKFFQKKGYRANKLGYDVKSK